MLEKSRRIHITQEQLDKARKGEEVILIPPGSREIELVGFDKTGLNIDYKERNQKMNGTIKRLVADRRFGFIKSDENGNEYFFHADDCFNGDFNSMKEGTKVSFKNVEYTPRGPRAQDVVKNG